MVRSQKKIIINFDRKLYKLRAIRESIKIYSHLAGFEIEPKKEFIQVKLANIDKSAERIIKDEFCNYVLFLMQK